MRTFRTLLAVVALQVAVSASAQQILVGATNSIWSYLADGSDQGTAWLLPDFNDSSWPTGRALFGNDPTAGYPFPFVTAIPGPNTGGPITVYYRTTFNWSGAAAGVILTMTNYVDDG